MRNKLLWLLVGSAVCFLCIGSHPGLHAWQENSDSTARQEAQNQLGEFRQKQRDGGGTPDAKRALLMSDAVFAAYCRAPLLSPPRGFELLHNVSTHAPEHPGLPIPVHMAFIMLEYDGSRRLPNGRFAAGGEGPGLGHIDINKVDCDSPGLAWGGKESPFHLLPIQTGTVQGWPVFGENTVFMTRRTKPRWLPVTVERYLSFQIPLARKDLEEAMKLDESRPQNFYAKFMRERDQRLREYQKAHDEAAKFNKKGADDALAAELETEKQMEKVWAEKAEHGADENQQIDERQAQARKALQDLESLTPEQRAAPAYVFDTRLNDMDLIKAFKGTGDITRQMYPPGTRGSAALVYANPDFYDRSLPAWEAQSVCVDISAISHPMAWQERQRFLYPVIVNILKSLDWDALAQLSMPKTRSTTRSGLFTGGRQGSRG